MKRKWDLYIVLFLLIGVLGIGYFFHLKKQSELSEFAKTTKGEILEVYSVPNRGYYIKYVYLVDKHRYEGHVPVEGKIENYNVGDACEVNYSVKNPKYSEINFK